MYIHRTDLATPATLAALEAYQAKNNIYFGGQHAIFALYSSSKQPDTAKATDMGKRYRTDSEASASASDDDEDYEQEVEYTINEILDHKEDKHGNREYFVSWVGFDEADNSWQREADMPSNRTFKTFLNAYWKSQGGDSRKGKGKKTRKLPTQYAAVESLACQESKPSDCPYPMSRYTMILLMLVMLQWMESMRACSQR